MTSVLLILSQVLLVAAVIGLVAYAAYCQDMALREAREAMDDTAGDCLTSADLIRMGVVNPDGTVAPINREPSPFWNACGSAAPGRDECGGSSGQVGNSPHSVIGAAGMPSTPSPSEQGGRQP